MLIRPQSTLLSSCAHCRIVQIAVSSASPSSSPVEWGFIEEVSSIEGQCPERMFSDSPASDVHGALFLPLALRMAIWNAAEWLLSQTVPFRSVQSGSNRCSSSGLPWSSSEICLSAEILKSRNRLRLSKVAPLNGACGFVDPQNNVMTFLKTGVTESRCQT